MKVVLVCCLLVVGCKSSTGAEPVRQPVASAPSPAQPPPSSPHDTSPKDATGRPHASHLEITGIEPEIGDAAGGTYVRIRGDRFVADGPRYAKVYFGSRQGTVVRFASDNELIVEAPGGQPNQTVDVLVIFEPGGEVKLIDAFTFQDRPGAPTK